jgi:hypothetical protein
MTTAQEARDFDSLDVREIREVLKEAANRLESPGLDGSEDLAPTLVEGAELLLRTVATTLGECRRQTPYKPLFPVIDSEGRLKWCCSHSPEEHCAS